MNKKAAIEWITIAYHDLTSAEILFSVDHYTDSIGSDLQQAIEKLLKAIIASENRKIPKTHDLYEIYTQIDSLVIEEMNMDILYRATEYLKEDRYPNPHYCLPPRDEIEEVMHFSKDLFQNVIDLLKINILEITNT